MRGKPARPVLRVPRRGNAPGLPDSPTAASRAGWIFARLPSNRDRALVALYVSTGARASEFCRPRGAVSTPDAG